MNARNHKVPTRGWPIPWIEQPEEQTYEMPRVLPNLHHSRKSTLIFIYRTSTWCVHEARAYELRYYTYLSICYIDILTMTIRHIHKQSSLSEIS